MLQVLFPQMIPLSATINKTHQNRDEQLLGCCKRKMAVHKYKESKEEQQVNKNATLGDPVP